MKTDTGPGIPAVVLPHCVLAAVMGTMLFAVQAARANTITAVDTADLVGLFTSIAVGIDGLPIMSYYDTTNGDLKVAKCGNAACSAGNTITTVDSTGNVGYYSSIAIGTDGLPVISYYDIANGDLKVAKCGSAACSSGNTITTVDATGDVGWYTSIAIGVDGLPVISYYNSTDVDLKVAKCGNAACSAGNAIATVDTIAGVGLYSSIAIGADGLPVISYHDFATDDLKVAKCGNAGCSAGNTITTVDASGLVGEATSIAIGADGLPVISYYDASNRDLKVLKCGDAACSSGNTISTVDSAGDVGWDRTSIAIGTDGLPVIAYYDVTNFDLKVAKCGNVACAANNTVTTVDALGIVGRHTSIVIGADSFPVISYWDFTNYDLKVVKCANAACAPLRLRASLSSGQEVPPEATAATGTASMTFNLGTNLLTWNITFGGLTGGFTAAHFHGPAQVGQEAPPVITISGNASPLTGSATLTSAQATELLAGLWYINIHSGSYTDGEIRGQVVPPNTRADFNADGRSDILWRHAVSGENYLYPMDGTTILASEGYLRTVADLNWTIAGSGDLDGDGKADILWRNSSSGENYIYFMDGTAIKPTEGYIRTVADQNWRVAGVGDFDGDGKDDILWRNASSGQNYVYFMNGLSIANEGYLRTVADTTWEIKGVGDFDGDGKADVLWRNSATGENYVYLMNQLNIAGEGYLRTVADQAWQVKGVGDLNGDGRADIVWRNSNTGENYLYPMDGAVILAAEDYLRTVADQAWQIAALGDYNGDGKSDLVWRNSTTGENYIYLMSGASIVGEGYIRTVADLNWAVEGAAP